MDLLQVVMEKSGWVLKTWTWAIQLTDVTTVIVARPIQRRGKWRGSRGTCHPNYEWGEAIGPQLWSDVLGRCSLVSSLVLVHLNSQILYLCDMRESGRDTPSHASRSSPSQHLSASQSRSLKGLVCISNLFFVAERMTKDEADSKRAIHPICMWWQRLVDIQPLSLCLLQASSGGFRILWGPSRCREPSLAWFPFLSARALPSFPSPTVLLPFPSQPSSSISHSPLFRRCCPFPSN